MDENRARRVADALRDRGINAHLAKASVDQYGVRVSLPGGRDEQQVIDAIAWTDYDQPVARQRAVAPPPAPSLPHEGGVFRRFLDAFRYR
jgi:hypothetical protein